MPPNKPNPPTLAAGSGVIERQAAKFDLPETIKSNPAAQAAISALTRDFEIEAARLDAIRHARGAAVKLNHLADNLGLGDDVTAGRDRQLAREYWEGMALALERLNAALAAGADSQAEGSA